MTDKKNLVLNIIFLCCLFLLSFLFIYSGDDWAWGSSIGIDRLKIFFDNYNGRYLGNLCVLVLSRSHLLKSIIVTLTLFAIIKLVNMVVNKDNKYLTLVAMLLTLAIPKFMFRQAIVWTSGFTNYVIPVVFLLIYFWFLKRLKHSKLSAIFMFLLGICSTLFIEHLTIYCLLLSIFVLVLELCRKKRVTLSNVLYFIGCLAGTIIMFTNRAYYSISISADSYRTAQTSGIYNMIQSGTKAYFDTIYKELIFNNVALIIFIVLLMTILSCVFLLRNTHNLTKQKKITLYISNFITTSFVIYQLLCFINPEWQVLLKYTNYFNGIYSALLCISIIIITWLTIKDKEIKIKALFCLFSIILLTAPLLVVTPIGSRCFFPMYIFFILFICTILDYLIKQKIIEISTPLKIITIFITLTLYIYLVSIYGYIYKSDRDRIEYINKQINNGKEIIEIKALPYPNYVWVGDPKIDIWNDRYKLFYGIDDKIEIRVIDRK